MPEEETSGQRFLRKKPLVTRRLSKPNNLGRLLVTLKGVTLQLMYSRPKSKICAFGQPRTFNLGSRILISRPERVRLVLKNHWKEYVSITGQVVCKVDEPLLRYLNGIEEVKR